MNERDFSCRRCLGPVESRPSALQLLDDAFFLKRPGGPDVQVPPPSQHGSVIFFLTSGWTHLMPTSLPLQPGRL